MYPNNVTKQLECAPVERITEEALSVETYARLFETELMQSLSIVRDGRMELKVRQLMEVLRFELRARLCEVESALDCNYEKCDVDFVLELPQSARQYISEQQSNGGFPDVLFSLFLCDKGLAETCNALMAGHNAGHNLVERMAVRLLGTVKEPKAQACFKGKFFDRMQAKLKQLTTQGSNELVRINLQAMADAMAASTDIGDGFKHDIARGSSRRP